MQCYVTQHALKRRVMLPLEISSIWRSASSIKQPSVDQLHMCTSANHRLLPCTLQPIQRLQNYRYWQNRLITVSPTSTRWSLQCLKTERQCCASKVSTSSPADLNAGQVQQLEDELMRFVNCGFYRVTHRRARSAARDLKGRHAAAHKHMALRDSYIWGSKKPTANLNR